MMKFFQSGVAFVLVFWMLCSGVELNAQNESLGIQADSCLTNEEVGVRFLSIEDYSDRGPVDGLQIYIEYDQLGLEYRSLDQSIDGFILGVSADPGIVKINELLSFGIPSFLNENTLVVSAFFRCIDCGGYDSQVRLISDSSWITFENGDTLYLSGEGFVNTLCPEFNPTQSDTTLCAGTIWEGVEITADTTLVFESIDDCGCIEEEFVQINVADLPEWNFTQEALNCEEGSSIISLFSSGGAEIDLVLWEDGIIGTFREVSGKGNLLATITFSNGCSTENLIEWIAAGDIDAEIFTQELSGQIRLTAEVAGIPDLYGFQWSTGETEREILVNESGTYEVTITDVLDCTEVLSVDVEVESKAGVYIPNAFSPNGDGVNDYWGVLFADDQATMELVRIFDAWGAVVYERQNITARDAVQLWDGYHSNSDDKVIGPVVYQMVIIEENGREKVYHGVINISK